MWRGGGFRGYERNRVQYGYGYGYKAWRGMLGWFTGHGNDGMGVAGNREGGEATRAKAGGRRGRGKDEME